MDTCDKCGTSVLRKNDLGAVMEYIGDPRLVGGSPLGGPGTEDHRHFLPVYVYGGSEMLVCEGSPSRAQYLFGKLRDSREGAIYYPDQEIYWRYGFLQLQQEPTYEAWDYSLDKNCLARRDALVASKGDRIVHELKYLRRAIREVFALKETMIHQEMAIRVLWSVGRRLGIPTDAGGTDAGAIGMSALEVVLENLLK